MSQRVQDVSASPCSSDVADQALVVGSGMLSASVSGDIFGSPSARQVYGAIRSVPSDAGTIVVITNYTGDVLHFSSAIQRARANGVPNIRMLRVTDDVSIPYEAGKLVGRRAIGGTTLVCKVLGAASQARRHDFESLCTLGQAVIDGLASIGASTGRSHVPGRKDFEETHDTIELGVGVHNEPGYFVLHPKPSAEDLVDKMMDLVLRDDDPERSFVKFARDDEIVLLVNNMGGLSPLECNAVVDQALTRLGRSGLRRPRRIYSGAFVTTLNAPGVSITLFNLTQAAQQGQVSVDDLLAYLDAPHSSLAWLSTVKYDAEPVTSTEDLIDDAINDALEAHPTGALKASPDALRRALCGAAQHLYDAEPQLTKWDTLVGDGDCGETCQGGADAILKAVTTGDLGSSGDVVNTLSRLSTLIDESCGGTLGAIVSIFFGALTAEVAAAQPSTLDGSFWGPVVHAAVQTLMKTTAARVGHRTIMDALIPFADTLKRSGDLALAVAAAEQGAQSTIPLTAKLGRATYVGQGHSGPLPPDPGAMAVVYVVKGLAQSLA